jgi:hypothetical protein
MKYQLKIWVTEMLDAETFIDANDATTAVKQAAKYLSENISDDDLYCAELHTEHDAHVATYRPHADWKWEG